MEKRMYITSSEASLVVDIKDEIYKYLKTKYNNNCIFRHNTSVFSVTTDNAYNNALKIAHKWRDKHLVKLLLSYKELVDNIKLRNIVDKYNI